MQKTTKIILALAGVGGVLYLLSKSKNSDKFKDKELQKEIDDLKKIPELPPVFVPTGVTVPNPSPWVDTRPSYDMACYPENIEDALNMPECRGEMHIKNWHLVKNGWGAPAIQVMKDVKELTKDEFDNAILIKVNGRIMPKGYYIDYIVKPDPKVIGEEMQKKIDAELKGLYIYDDNGNVIGMDMAANKKFVVVKEIPVNPPLDKMQPDEVIAKYDPDFVEEKRRIFGTDCCPHSRRAEVIYTNTGGGGYSHTKIVDGVKYGVPNVGATASYIITAQDNLLDENGLPIVDEQGYQYWKYYKDVDRETAIARGWVNYKKVAGVVLYRKDYVMTESGDWVPVLRNF
jgi:hypothetical protein